MISVLDKELKHKFKICQEKDGFEEKEGKGEVGEHLEMTDCFQLASPDQTQLTCCVSDDCGPGDRQQELT